MSPRLSLYFLGPPQINLDDEPITLERRKMAALLAYLAIERGTHQRASLSALLWPDYEQAKAYKNLRQTLWEIQQAAGENWLIASREKIGLNEDADIWLDIAQFDSLTEKSRSEADVSLRASLLADSAKLYRNHFLTGFSLKDAHPFNDWAFAEAEELKRKLANVLITLSNDYCALGDANQAIPHARRLVSLDPLNESAHRQLMEVYIQAGQHNAALKQYQTCEQILRKELNLDPQPETRELYKRIRKGEAKPAPVKKQAESFIPQHNLPHQVSTFIGREKEQAEVRNLIQKNRLVTLMGAGGIGKTTMALKLGHSLLHNHPDGVWFIALDALSNPALTAQTVASIFNIREGTDRPLLDRLNDFLRTKNALLIFDNCEHLLDACAQLITTLLGNCPDLKVLATSREALGVLGEAVYTLPSLPIPEPGVDVLDTLTEYESIKLFADRAALASTSFQLTKDNIGTVVDICRKVDGIPLAIELAAARVNILQVEEILNQLNESFALLTSDRRTILPRHQTLRASIEWGWNLLDNEEQVFLRQLSVFAGGWTLDAAQKVCDGNVLGLTGTLVKKSLIVVNQEAGRETRYRFHEMVRQFVHGKAIESAEHDEVHARHLKYFVNLSEKAELELRGSSRVGWMERLDDESNNIRAALHWADKTDVEAGLYLSSRLMRYWESLNLPEGDQWLRNFIEKPESKEYPRARAWALHTYATLLTWLLKFDEGYAVANEALTLFRLANDREGEVDALIVLGNILQFKDDMKASIKVGEKALALSQSIGDRWREASALNYLGWGYADDHAARFKHWEQAINLYRKVGDQISLANLLGVLGQFQVVYGDLTTGEKNLDEALALWEANKKANVWENPKIAKSLIALLQGRYEEAQTLLEEVLYSAEQTGNLMSYLWAQVRLGYVAFHAGNFSEARHMLGEAAHRFMEGGNTIGMIYALEGLAGLYATLGKTDRSARLIGLADATREKIDDTRPPLEQADVDMSIAACLARMDKNSFWTAYEEGKKLKFKEAMELALQ